MYNSSYSQASFGLAAKKMHKQKGKSCGYYMKIVFFFSSLIQSLIIASLVLFLVYGQPEHTVEEKRLQELDQSVGKLTMENFILRGKEKNLTKVLNVTLTAKLINDKLLTESRRLANISAAAIKSLQTSLSRCEMEKRMTTSRSACPPAFCPDPNDKNRNLQSMLQQSAEMLNHVKANFTQTMAIMKTELENSNKDKDEYHLQAITLRRDKVLREEELILYQKKCKEDFVSSLSGIPSVTKEFLKRIDELFSKHISFQLTCDKQRIQLENIRENCSSLSRDVENKLQSYLDIVGTQFTTINGENAKYRIDNLRLKEDAEWCSNNRTIMIGQNRRTLEQLQIKCDQDSEKILLENRKLKGDNDLKENLLSVKEKQIKMLSDNINTLNASLISCKRPNPFLPNPFGPPNVPNTGGTGLSKPSLPWPGTGSSGSSFPSINGAGSSSRWGSAGGTGALSTGLGSTALGSASTRPGIGASSLGGAGTGLTGLGTAGSGPTVTGGIGQSGTGSTFGSAGLGKPAIGGAGFNPPAFGATLGGARTTAGGIDSQSLSQAQISLHLKELHRFSLPN